MLTIGTRFFTWGLGNDHLGHGTALTMVTLARLNQKWPKPPCSVSAEREQRGWICEATFVEVCGKKGATSNASAYEPPLRSWHF